MAGPSESGERSDLLLDPHIAAIQALVVKNVALASILGEQHTTQPFSTAQQLMEAFQGKLAAAGQTGSDAMKAAKVQYANLIQLAGITDEDLVNLFQRVWIYSRLTNPTNELLEEAISAIDGTEKTAVFASGLAAIDAAVRQFVPPASRDGELYKKGGKIMVVGSIYGGTYAQLMNMCAETGREFAHLSISDFVEKGLPDDVSMVLCESSNNPTLKVVPLQRIAQEAKRVGAVSVCDNTFTPLTVRPAENGIDLTIASMTKYFNGQSEDLGGSVSGKAELINRFLDLHSGRRMLGGAIMAPRVAKEFLQHLTDLPERLLRATQNAKGVREVATRHGFQARTLEDSSTYTTIRNQAIPSSLGNGMVALFLDDAAQASAFVDEMIRKGVGSGAVSLGASTTYYCIPGQTTHSEMPQEELDRIGITPGLVRISCGLEPDLVERFEEVLASFSK